MSTGWSVYIIVLTVLNILGCLWLLWWTSRRRPDEGQGPATTGHTWDEDLTEYNKPLPKWWLNLFYLTIAFSFVYLALYPGLGAIRGYYGWTSEGERAQVAAEEDAKLKPLFAQYAAMPIESIGQDARALELGRSVFSHNCATCHGSDARGARGFPNLTDADWLWGGTSEAVLATILNGRQAAMPALGSALGEQGVNEVAVYVQSLSGQNVDPALARGGAQRFGGICAACHGPDGKGNPALGAPNLTDAVWLYGSDFASIVETVRNGRNGNMPAHKGLIGEDRSRIVAAWVLAQSAKAPVGAGGSP